MMQNLVKRLPVSRHPAFGGAEDRPRHLRPELLTTGFALLLHKLTILSPVVLAFISSA